MLGLVEDALAGAAVDLAVLGAADLVAELLGAGLGAVGLEAAAVVLASISMVEVSNGNIPSSLVTSIGNSLLDLLLGRLGRVGSHALLHLGGEVFASEIGHDGG